MPVYDVSVTTYRNDGMASNGHTYTQNRRHFGPICAVLRGGPFRREDKIALVSRGGQRYVVTACDTIRRGSDIDLDTQSAREFMGPHYKLIGRVSASATIISRAHHHREKHW